MSMLQQVLPAFLAAGAGGPPSAPAVEAEDSSSLSSDSDDGGKVTSSASMLKSLPRVRLSQCLESVESIFDSTYTSELTVTGLLCLMCLAGPLVIN